MKDGWKVVWSILYISVAFFPSLKQNFIAYHSSKVSSCPDCIFEIHQLWQSGFSRVYSNYCCSCSFEAEIIKIGQSSHKMYSNNILNFQESTTILNACTKSLETYWMNHVVGWSPKLKNFSTEIKIFLWGNNFGCFPFKKLPLLRKLANFKINSFYMVWKKEFCLLHKYNNEMIPEFMSGIRVICLLFWFSLKKCYR